MFNFILGLIIGGGVVWIVLKRGGPSTSSGSNIINPKQVEEKRENLEKVLELAREKRQISNDDVERTLDVSNATAERYLQELEEQGKLVQVGTTGRNVLYRLKQ